MEDFREYHIEYNNRTIYQQTSVGEESLVYQPTLKVDIRAQNRTLRTTAPTTWVRTSVARSSPCATQELIMRSSYAYTPRSRSTKSHSSVSLSTSQGRPDLGPSACTRRHRTSSSAHSSRVSMSRPSIGVLGIIGEGNWEMSSDSKSLTAPQFEMGDW